jgi:hypothetical protein
VPSARRRVSGVSRRTVTATGVGGGGARGGGGGHLSRRAPVRRGRTVSRRDGVARGGMHVLTVGCHLLAGHLWALSACPLRRPRGRRPPPGWASAWPLVARTNRRPAHNSAPDLTTGSAAGDVTAGTLPQRQRAARSSRTTSLDAHNN